jgi:hypothetical protein
MKRGDDAAGALAKIARLESPALQLAVGVEVIRGAAVSVPGHTRTPAPRRAQPRPLTQAARTAQALVHLFQMVSSYIHHTHSCCVNIVATLLQCLTAKKMKACTLMIALSFCHRLLLPLARSPVRVKTPGTPPSRTSGHGQL